MIYHLFSILLAVWLVLLGACSGVPASKNTPVMPPTPERISVATLAGPLCSASECRCKTSDAEAGVPASAAVKRYEIVLGPTDNELWASVGKMTLYKGREHATECFYLDLASPGEHPVTLRAHGDGGFGAHLTIRELQASGPAWYSTFDFVCGGPGACRNDQLSDFRASLNKYERGIHDPCGSTKISKLSWDTGRMPDISVPADLYLTFSMKLYAFVPEHPPGDDSCKNNYK